MLRRRRWISRAAVGIVTAALCAVPAVAADAVTDVDTVPKNKKMPWINWGLGVLFIAGCVGLAVKNPHRSHLD